MKRRFRLGDKFRPRAPSFFTAFSTASGRWAATSSAFIAACASIITWIVTGPLYHYSDTWQLVINTGTTIVTFLMSFLIQNSTAREMAALHLKVDTLLMQSGADPKLLSLDNMDLADLDKIHAQVTAQAKRLEEAATRRRRKQGRERRP